MLRRPAGLLSPGRAPPSVNRHVGGRAHPVSRPSIGYRASLKPGRQPTDTGRMRRLLFGSVGPVLLGCAALPVALLVLLGKRMVMPPMWVHFYGVGVSALAATAAAVALTTAGARRGDVRTVIV